MRDTLTLLERVQFPPLRRARLDTLQINVGYRCNQTCRHCHVDAGPRRTEEMDRDTVDLVLDVLGVSRLPTLDITGGAPELNPHFRYLVERARSLGVRVIDRCNLTVFSEPGFEDLPDFLATHGVEITASLPCYLEDNVDRQRGKGVFDKSIRALLELNARGYADESTGLILNLVYNPQGPVLPPGQEELEAAYRRELGTRFGVRFNRLLTLANMPIKRFGATLIAQGQFDDYLDLLRGAHRDENLEHVMCRTLLSVDWQGYLYDCDFNQMLGIPMQFPDERRAHLRDLITADVTDWPIAVRAHCYGCTAGQGSSCGGALS